MSTRDGRELLVLDVENLGKRTARGSKFAGLKIAVFTLRTAPIFMVHRAAPLKSFWNRYRVIRQAQENLATAT